MILEMFSIIMVSGLSYLATDAINNGVENEFTREVFKAGYKFNNYKIRNEREEKETDMSFDDVIISKISGLIKYVPFINLADALLYLQRYYANKDDYLDYYFASDKLVSLTKDEKEDFNNNPTCETAVRLQNSYNELVIKYGEDRVREWEELELDKPVYTSTYLSNDDLNLEDTEEIEETSKEEKINSLKKQLSDIKSALEELQSDGKTNNSSSSNKVIKK